MEEKKIAKKCPLGELKKIRKRVAELRKAGQEVFTDDMLEEEGWEVMLEAPAKVAK